MPISYTETDNTSPVCANNTCGTVAGGRRTAENGGTAGSSEITLTINAGSQRDLGFTILPADSVTFDGGSATFRIEVTTANMNLEWDRVQVARLNSSCVLQETLDNFTGLAIDCSTGGVKSTTQTLSAASTHDSGDRICVFFEFINTAMGGSSDLGVTPSQDIDTPWTAQAAMGLVPKRRVPNLYHMIPDLHLIR